MKSEIGPVTRSGAACDAANAALDHTTDLLTARAGADKSW